VFNRLKYSWRYPLSNKSIPPIPSLSPRLLAGGSRGGSVVARPVRIELWAGLGRALRVRVWGCARASRGGSVAVWGPARGSGPSPSSLARLPPAPAALGAVPGRAPTPAEGKLGVASGPVTRVPARQAAGQAWLAAPRPAVRVFPGCFLAPADALEEWIRRNPLVCIPQVPCRRVRSRRRRGRGGAFKAQAPL